MINRNGRWSRMTAFPASWIKPGKIKGFDVPSFFVSSAAKLAIGLAVMAISATQAEAQNACCGAFGTCSEVTECSACAGTGEVCYPGESCNGNGTCSACCHPDTSCTQVPDCVDCDGAHDVCHEDSACANVYCPPPTGACCQFGSCVIAPQVGCENNSGTYQGDFSDCASVVCCTSDAACVDAFSCNDPDECNLGTGACQHHRDDTKCDDGFSCTHPDQCVPTDPDADPVTGCITSRNDADCTAGSGGADGKTCTDDACNPDNALPGSTTGCQTTKVDSNCFDNDDCTLDECNPNLGDPGSPSGCVYPKIDGCCEVDPDCPDPSDPCMEAYCDQGDSICAERPIPGCGASLRVGISTKGSLLYFSKIELKWNAAGALTQDTFLTIVNDYPADVFVQWYFINGDAPLAPVIVGGLLTERGHRGWNWVDCTTLLTHDESNYMSAATGNPLGCQPITILDPGFPRGRPDLDGAPGDRILRGYAVAFAVDNNGNEISWNHLSGSVDLVDYANRSAWEINGFAFQCLITPTPGAPCGSDHVLDMDGVEYVYGFGQLLFDFYSVGSQAFSLNAATVVTLDTDLTLYPVSADLRQDNEGPITTKAKMDIWNQNEDGFSGSTHCITCWDQTLISNYGAPNNFLIGNLHTDKGKARIDGVPSDVCDPPGACCNLVTDPDCYPSVDHPFIDESCSQPASLLGVSDKILIFSGAVVGRTDAGMTLVGQGTEPAYFKWDVITPPQPLRTGPDDQFAPAKVGVERSTTTPRTLSRGQRTGKD